MSYPSLHDVLIFRLVSQSEDLPNNFEGLLALDEPINQTLREDGVEITSRTRESFYLDIYGEKVKHHALTLLLSGTYGESAQELAHNMVTILDFNLSFAMVAAYFPSCDFNDGFFDWTFSHSWNDIKGYSDRYKVANQILGATVTVSGAGLESQTRLFG